MLDHPFARTAAALDKVIRQMEYLVAHPRIQQNEWVYQGKGWLPTLHQAKMDLTAENDIYQYVVEAHQAVWEALRRFGLEVRQRDRETWAYSWHGAPLVGAYPSQAQALEAALRERLPLNDARGMHGGL